VDEDAVPKLPRGKGIKLSGPELFRIGLLVVMLVAVLVLTKPCANAVSGFVTSFGSGSAAPSQEKPKKPQEYEQLRPGMSEDETKRAIERAKARARAGSASP
jgi:hypothetical protein